MIHVLNSAMMPAEGCYTLRKISGGQFMEMVYDAHKAGVLLSSVGYPQNLDFIRRCTGLELPLSRKETRIKDGDILLIMKLRYRVDGYPKGYPVSENDFEFFVADYSATTETR